MFHDTEPSFDPYERWEDADDAVDDAGDAVDARQVALSDYELYSMLDEDAIDHGAF